MINVLGKWVNGYSVYQKQFTLADKSFTKIQTHNFDGMNTRENISKKLKANMTKRCLIYDTLKSMKYNKV